MTLNAHNLTDLYHLGFLQKFRKCYSFIENEPYTSKKFAGSRGGLDYFRDSESFSVITFNKFVGFVGKVASENFLVWIKVK